MYLRLNLRKSTIFQAFNIITLSKQKHDTFSPRERNTWSSNFQLNIERTSSCLIAGKLIRTNHMTWACKLALRVISWYTYNHPNKKPLLTRTRIFLIIACIKNHTSERKEKAARNLVAPSVHLPIFMHKRKSPQSMNQLVARAHATPLKTKIIRTSI